MNYEIYVIEQFGKSIWNKAKLINVGVIEGILRQHFDNIQKDGGSQKFCYCVILHDIDMLPVRSLKNLILKRLSEHKNIRFQDYMLMDMN